MDFIAQLPPPIKVKLINNLNAIYHAHLMDLALIAIKDDIGFIFNMPHYGVSKTSYEMLMNVFSPVIDKNNAYEYFAMMDSNQTIHKDALACCFLRPVLKKIRSVLDNHGAFNWGPLDTLQHVDLYLKYFDYHFEPTFINQFSDDN